MSCDQPLRVSLRGNVLNRVEIDAVALDEAHAWNGGLPALAVYFVAEFLADNFEKFFEDGDGFAGIRAITRVPAR